MTDLTFWGFLQEGLRHITDPGGIDHMVFLLALIAGFEMRHAGKVILLATAFTLGHSITLALAAMRYVAFSSTWIEFLIPVTILLTALLTARKFYKKGRISFWRYMLTLGFGLIHGLGFTSYFRMILPEGENVVSPLLAFNLGIEVGQIAILLVLFFIFSLFEFLFGVRTERRMLFVSGIAAGMGVLFLVEKWPF